MARISDYVIGAILFTLVMAGLVDFMGGLASYGPYSVNTSSHFSTFYGEILENSTQSYSDVSKPIAKKTEGEGDLIISTAGDSTLKMMYSVIKLPFTSVRYIWTTLTTISVRFGLPIWAVNAIVGLIVVVIGFAILNALFRRDT